MFDGVVLVNKPESMSSFEVVKFFKRYLKKKVRIGHAGTLDPMATGLLPLCLGRATKLTQFIMVGLKEYRGQMVLGKRTDTYDREGEVIEERPVSSDLTIEDLRRATKNFLGKIKQVPPPFSAAKHKGTPLYVFARKGIKVEKEPKEIFIKDFEIVRFHGGNLVDFRIVCSKGTYVRSIVDDFGKIINTGAFLNRLLRTKVGPFTLDEAYDLEEIKGYLEEGRISEIMLDQEYVLSHIPSVEIDRYTASDVVRGILLDIHTIEGLLKKQNINVDPIIPYLRLKVEPNGSEAFTVAVANWPPCLGDERVKMAKVFVTPMNKESRIERRVEK
ncbi:tRNA pseudouridine synthase B [Dissulfuribacter thermophilus]|uniref:tRNA pseudouridine synthase B n=1 Tax=Dissulfuribacter thermophilus TaxID=1156395 RepID=A0A1B9F6Q0_9BACT|nr:tRNA pseudouridine(55) synthase TruB [Dissulfuribacter thermophilus]OCC15451.1 tRNA pseudouridine synthase B [Dissulfuribacter thermophilus]